MVNVKVPSVTDLVKIGDYVDYDPTYLDALKTQGVEQSKLTYTSPTGSGTSHGNGYISSENGGGQTFTATSNDKWRVINKTNSTIELISENQIKSDIGNSFVLQGAIGYLYAEQELNEICKIYGYGYGADTSLKTQYTIGGPLDSSTGTIIGSGARSLTLEDINKFAGIYKDEIDGKMKYNDGTNINANYGSNANPTQNVYYPTKTTENGKSTSAGVKNLTFTKYGYSNSKIEDGNIWNLLFDGVVNYHLASRYVYTSADSTYYGGFHISGYSFRAEIGGEMILEGNKSRFKDGSMLNDSIRPIVFIKNNVIDISNVTQNNDGINVWKLK